jgi:hypothetical protein
LTGQGGLVKVRFKLFRRMFMKKSFEEEYDEVLEILKNNYLDICNTCYLAEPTVDLTKDLSAAEKALKEHLAYGRMKYTEAVNDQVSL